MRGDTTDFGPIPGAAEEGPRRSRIGTSRLPWWGCGWIGLLLLALIVLPWLPISWPSGDGTPARRVRGVGDTAILTFAFAPHEATIATIQTDGRVALRDVAGGAGAHPFLDYRGFALALAFSPDGRSLAVGGAEPDIFLYDVEAGGAGRPLGMPIRCGKGLAFSPDGRTLAASSYRRERGPPLGPRRGAGAGPAAGPRVPRDQPGVRPRWPVPGLGGPWRRGDRPLGPRHEPGSTAAGRAAGSGDLPGLLTRRPLARLGRRSRSTRPAVGPRGPTRGPADRGPFAREEPAGLLARRADAGHRRRGWGRAAVGSRDAARSFAGWAGRAIGSPAWRSRPTAGRWPRPGTTPTSGSGTWASSWSPGPSRDRRAGRTARWPGHFRRSPAAEGIRGLALPRSSLPPGRPEGKDERRTPHRDLPVVATPPLTRRAIEGGRPLTIAGATGSWGDAAADLRATHSFGAPGARSSASAQTALTSVRSSRTTKV